MAGSFGGVVSRCDPGAAPDYFSLVVVDAGGVSAPSVGGVWGNCAVKPGDAAAGDDPGAGDGGYGVAPAGVLAGQWAGAVTVAARVVAVSVGDAVYCGAHERLIKNPLRHQ